MAAITIYVDASIGDDTNSGSTTSASPKANGTAAATTSSSATIALTADTPDLSAVVVGDTILLTSRTDGRNLTDIFEITAVDDGADTVTVNEVPDSNTTGVTWAIGGARKKVEKGFVSCVGGDKCYVKGTFTATVDLSSPAGAIGALTTPVTLEGYTTTPGDGGRFTIDGGGVAQDGIIVKSSVAFWHLKNIHITDCTRQGIRGVLGGSEILYENVECDNCLDGFNCNNNQLFINCSSHDNSSYGFNVGDTCAFSGCLANNNTDTGFRLNGGGTIISCVAKGNGINGIYQVDDKTHARFVVINSLIDGDGKVSNVGIHLVDDTVIGSAMIVNNVIIDCVLGIEMVSDHGVYKFSFGNCLYNNTTNYSNFNTSRLEVTAAPSFVNEGTDYTPASGSPLIGAGFDFSNSGYMTITGHQTHIGLSSPKGAHEPGITLASVGDVRTGTVYSGGTGILALPTAAQVELAVGFGSSGTEFTGTLVATSGDSPFLEL